MAWYGVAPGWQLLMLPLFVLLAFGLSLGLGLLLAALNVEYRDFRYIVPFIVQFGLFISPIAYTTADVPERWRLLYSLNPMVGIIDGFRWCILARPSAAGPPGGWRSASPSPARRCCSALVLPPHGAKLRRRDLTRLS